MQAGEARESQDADDPGRARQAPEVAVERADPLDVRAGIAASWRRSQAHGVLRDSLAPPYDERAIDLDSHLLRAADPVLDQLAADLAATASCVAVTDHRGLILRRVTGDPRIDDALDAVFLAPGFNYSERFVGTNALGTALHEQALVSVRAREHFNDRLTGLSCFAAPLRDPVTGQVLGAVGLGVAAGAGSAPYAAVVRQAAALIEKRHFDLRTEGQRGLYGTYLDALQRGRDRAFVLAADLLLAPPQVMQHLGAVPHDQLWALTVDALAHRPEAEVALTLPCGGVVGVHLRAVEHHGRVLGALGELRPPEARHSTPTPAAPVLPPREYTGWSVPARSAAMALRRLAEERRPACIAGEVGTGKATMAEVVAARVFPGDSLLSLTTAEAADGDLLARVTDHLATGSPVLLRHVDDLPAESLTELLEAAERAPQRGWLAVTWRPDPESSARVVPPSPLRLVTLPPLRSRPEDVPKAVDRMLRRHPEGRRVAFTPALLERLRREAWPTNLTGLHEVVEGLLRRRSGPVLDVADLDEVLRATVRRRLTPVEWLLRAAIVDALRTHNGNKELAAESLGMSRASIYRKIKSLDIDVEAVIRD